MRILRIGLIGAARVAPYAVIGPAHENPRASVIAIAAMDRSRAKRFAQKHGISRAHATYASLLADPEIDLVYIATPPDSHAALALAAIEAGKHVMVEKPFAMNAGEAADVAMAARDAKLEAFEAMHAPHHRLFTELAAVVTSGRFGAIISVAAHFSTHIERSPLEFRWSACRGGGALMDLGVYPLAFCRRLLGEQFRVCNAHAEMDAGVDTRGQVELDFAGVPARLAFSMIDPTSAFLEVICEHGSLRAENPVAPSLGHRLIESTTTKTHTRTFPGPSSWSSQLEAIVATILDGAPFPFGQDDMIASMNAIDRIRSHPDWLA